MYLTLGEGVEKGVWVPSNFWLEELNGGNAFQGSKGTGGGVWGEEVNFYLKHIGFEVLGDIPMEKS